MPTHKNWEGIFGDSLGWPACGLVKVGVNDVLTSNRTGNPVLFDGECKYNFYYIYISIFMEYMYIYKMTFGIYYDIWIPVACATKLL